MASFHTKIQVLIIVYLVVSIAIQISVRQRSGSFPALSISHVDTSRFQDFLMLSDSLENQETDTSTHNSPQYTEINANGSHGSMGANMTQGLWCIDIVRKCARFKSEKIPNAPTQNSTTSTTPKTKSMSTTLALALPVLKGGYRNQYMRFVTLVAQALSTNRNIMLQSVKWGEKLTHNGIPFELLFHVDTWNAHPNLPKLVSFSPLEHPHWNPKSTVFRGTCPITIQWFPAPHRVSFMPLVQNLTQPYAAGGARSGRPGNLFDTYRKHDKYGLLIRDETNIDKTSIDNNKNTNTNWITLQQLEEWILASMTPSTVIQGIVDALKPTTPYIALHPRVEPEMLSHRYCQEGKVRRMSILLEQIKNYPDFRHFSQLFVAISMSQMEERQRANALWYKDHVENVQVLKDAFQNGLFRLKEFQARIDPLSLPLQQKIHVWTAGETKLEHVVNPCMLTLVSSLVSMELACDAAVFVGTRVSSWSMSVWKIRYYRGLPNYEFTSTGIQLMEGLPPAFKC